MVVVDDDAAASAHAEPGSEGPQLAGVLDGNEVGSGKSRAQAVGGVSQVADGGATEDKHAAFFGRDGHVIVECLGR